MYVCMYVWNGMEWNGMEWNGMEWNVMLCMCVCMYIYIYTHTYIHICFIKIVPSESNPHSTRFVSKKSATLPANFMFFSPHVPWVSPSQDLARYEVLEGYCEPNSFTDTLCSASSSVQAQAPVKCRCRWVVC